MHGAARLGAKRPNLSRVAELLRPWGGLPPSGAAIHAHKGGRHRPGCRLITREFDSPTNSLQTSYVRVEP
eukprot:1195207-Prorocentrum_minimum.AAC.5